MPFAAATPRRSCRATTPRSASPFAVPRRPGERRGTRTTGSGRLNEPTWSAPAHGAAFGHGSPKTRAEPPPDPGIRFATSPQARQRPSRSRNPFARRAPCRVRGAQPRLGNIRTRPAIWQEGATAGASNARRPTLRCVSGCLRPSRAASVTPWLRTSPGHGGSFGGGTLDRTSGALSFYGTVARRSGVSPLGRCARRKDFRRRTGT